MFSNTSELAIEQGSRSKLLLIFATSVISLIALVCSLSLLSTRAAVAVVAAWTVLIWICICFARKHFDWIVMAWIITFPFCYYFFSFPRERPLFTVDRTFVLLVLLVLITAFKQVQVVPLQPEIRIAAYLWAAYLFACLVSLWGHSVADVLGSYRLIVDGMLLPAILGLYAIRYFPVTKNLPTIHVCVCLLMLGIAIVAGLELFTGKNLLPWTGAVQEWVQSTDAKIMRVDGPFENSSVLSLVGTLGFLLIFYLRRLIADSMTSSQRILHLLGVGASFASALMPMNRGLVIALLVCASIDYFSKAPLIPRGAWNFIFALLLFVVLVGKLFYPDVYEDRVTRGDNLYQRIAQDRQTLEVVRDHPFTGVGYNLYHDTVHGDSEYFVRWRGFEAMDYPHNSLMSVLAEEGAIGVSLYIAAQLFLVRAMRRIRDVNILGWQVFLYCLLVYTIFGLDVGIAYYSDLNLFYMLVLGIILQIQLRMFVEGRPPNGFHYL